MISFSPLWLSEVDSSMKKHFHDACYIKICYICQSAYVNVYTNNKNGLVYKASQSMVYPDHELVVD